MGYWISQNDPRCHLTWPTPASGGYVPVPDPVQFPLIPRRRPEPAGAGRPSCGSTAPAWANRRHAASITLRNLVFNHVQALRFRLPDGICGAAGTYGRVENANQAAFTIPRDSPFHNVSIPVGDATLTRSTSTTYEQRVPRQVCAVWSVCPFLCPPWSTARHSPPRDVSLHPWDACSVPACATTPLLNLIPSRS